jgi:predicted PurR-regulated permease PerM
MPDSFQKQSGLLVQVFTAVLLFVATAWVLQDYWIGLAWAGILAAVFWPLTRLFAGRWRHLGAAVSSVLAVSVVALPIAFVILEMAQGVSILLPRIRAEIARSWPFPEAVAHLLPTFLLHPAQHAWAGLRTALAGVVPGLPDHNVHRALGVAYIPVTSSLWTSVELLFRHSGLILSILGGAEYSLVNAGIALLTLHFLLAQGDAVQQGLSVRVQHFWGIPTWKILVRGVRILRGTFVSMVATALFEGMLFFAVYGLAGVPHALLWATLSGLFSVVPFGASFAFVAVCLWLWLGQGAWIAAIVVFGAGYMITAFADNILKPLLIGGAARLPFVPIFLGLLGGLSTLGILGVFVGPMIMGMAQAWWESLYPREKDGNVTP